jgi:hypothetical protein
MCNRSDPNDPRNLHVREPDKDRRENIGTLNQFAEALNTPWDFISLWRPETWIDTF